ncbi:hypothetical protein J4050_07050 [Winogradskyella sp. DF17]|uniref:Multidrug transporter n=1 Tax=Winogradskyella pelagia TaxID=2819984 RepID=A0ABS3T179_9FLAO|nr:hypothetical protein [Winogradskyella sp. DF17]MBO3116498.1 hypothetical protein [Winogradskyella sp. DF17]
MGLFFYFLAVDEILRIHEHLNVPMRNLFDTSGVFYFAWVIPYSIIILLLGIYFYKFLLSLPVRTKVLFGLSLVVFVSGAIGIELLEGQQAEDYGMDNTTFFILYTIEESLEMIGSSIFCFALLDYISKTYKEVNLVFNSK